jgi:hypothetical protein
MINTVDDIIASAGVDLLLKEPFYAHLLSSIPRLISEKIKVGGEGLSFRHSRAGGKVNSHLKCNG